MLPSPMIDRMAREAIDLARQQTSPILAAINRVAEDRHPVSVQDYIRLVGRVIVLQQS